jgi:hypothetical protein
VLVNNAGSAATARLPRPTRTGSGELAVDVGTVVALARAFLPGMLARSSGGILNVASTIAFQPAPYQAEYGTNKAFVLSFSQALWAEARPAGVAVTALCPGPTRTGFVDALGADVGRTAIYRKLADLGPVIKAGLGALDQGRAVVIPGLRNKAIATGGRFMPRDWLTRVSGRLLRSDSAASRPPIDVHNEIVAPAMAEHVWDLLTDVEGWPSWYRAFHRNVEISSCYAWIHRREPACFKWAAMAAIASHHIRLVLFPLRLDTDRTGFVDIPHSLARRKLLLTEDVDTIRATNNAIFNDIFWVHLAYVTADDGIERLRALLQAERHYAPVLAGFEAIDQGRRVLADATPSAQARQAACDLIWQR